MSKRPRQKQVVESTSEEMRPRDFSPAPGILEHLTYRLRFNLNKERVELPPPDGRLRSILGRELGYSLLRALEPPRRRLRSDQPNALQARLRTPYRSLRSVFARSLLPPSEREESAWAPGGPRTGSGVSNSRVEVSRRVFQFEKAAAEQHGALVCHVVALQEREGTERLLVRFAQAVRQGKPAPSLFDRTTSMVLLSHPIRQPRLGRKWYCEIVIGPARAIEDLDDEVVMQATGETPGHDVWWTKRPRHAPPKLRIVDIGGSATGVQGHDVQHEEGGDEQAFETDAPSEDHTYAYEHDLDQGAIEQAKRDLEFVTHHIEQAETQGRPLGDQFIENLARRRLMHVRRGSAYPAGTRPTLETSLDIVRDIVELHKTVAGVESERAPEN